VCVCVLRIKHVNNSCCSLGEGAINVAVGPIRGQEVRVNGPIGAPGQMRMDVGFPGQPGPGNTSHLVSELQELFLYRCAG